VDPSQLAKVAAQIRPIAIGATAFVLAYLGVLSLAYHDTLLQWQPAPEGASWRPTLGLVSGIVLIAAGAGIAVPRLRRAAATLGALWLGACAVFLHLPLVAAAHADVASLNGLAENTGWALGLATLAAPAKGRLVLALRIGFGLCCIIFGAAHFQYADFTSKMVPEWLPERLAIAYLTGAIHFGTGVCLVIGIVPRIAALIEAAMMSSFVILLHVPRVIGAPNDRLELTMLGVAALLTLSAWLIATLPALKGKGTGSQV
jgi:uncharacterized membrane protein YphA (DoxX/SURF4 family)